MNLRYLLPRVVRHFMPHSLARWLLRHKIIIQPGRETSDPESAVRQYQAALLEYGRSFQHQRVMVFGYGGSFAVGCVLLRAGAQHVILCDRFAPPDHERNRALLPEYSGYLTQSGEEVLPAPTFFTLLDADIRQVAANGAVEPVDIILSSSVFEHLNDVEGIVGALARLTRAGGFGLHFIDLRDHFFQYPFEMLRFSHGTWRAWLNPTSNLNRYRLWDYRRAFEAFFGRVDIEILAQDEAALEKVRPALRREFLSGDREEDAATLLRVAVLEPRRP
jgi:SAM-dependent methyltransferase